MFRELSYSQDLYKKQIDGLAGSRWKPFKKRVKQEDTRYPKTFDRTGVTEIGER